MIMDPVGSVRWFGDTSFALMLSAQERGHRVFHCQARDLSLVDRQVRVVARQATMTDQVDPPITLGESVVLNLADVDVVFVRIDPPFDSRYLTVTHLLDHIRDVTLVVNDPRALRDANEKLYGCRFPDVMPPMIVTADREQLLSFAEAHDGAVLKAIDGHGGRGIMTLQPGDRNERAIVDQMTNRGRRTVMAQKFLDTVYDGDRRILLLDGELLGAISRTPSGGDFRANIGVGGTVELIEITASDQRVIDAIAPALRADGLWFVGLDVIGGFLSEVNVTSPSGVRHLARLTGTRPDHRILEWAEKRVGK